MKLKYAYAAVPCHNEAGGVPLLRSRMITAEESGIFIIAIEDAIQGEESPRLKKYLKSSNTPDLELRVKFVTERFDQLCSMTEEQASQELQRQRFFAKKASAPLLMAAMKNGRYLVCSCGDGIAGLIQGDMQKHWSVINQAQPGLEVAEPEGGSLKVYKGLLEKEFRLVLLNSGACVSLYNHGEEGISPACSTFGEWLKEYDGETVSRALTENIEKYFIKEKTGDICVAVVVPEAEEEAVEEEQGAPEIQGVDAVAEEEQVEEQPILAETSATAGNVFADEGDVAKTIADEGDVNKTIGDEGDSPKTGGAKRVILAAAVLVITAAVIIAAWLGQSGSENWGQVAPQDGPPEIAAEDGQEQEQGESGNGTHGQNGESQSDQSAQERDLSEIDPAEHEPMISFAVSQPEAYEPGFYRVGKDLPAGEYFFWTGEMLAKDSIEINGETALSDELYCMTVQVAEGETLSSNYRFTSVENVNPIKITGGILISGKYRIGKDILPGEYEIHPEKGKAPGRYYSVLNGKISNNMEIDGRTTVTVPEEGYIVFYRSYLAVPEA